MLQRLAYLADTFTKLNKLNLHHKNITVILLMMKSKLYNFLLRKKDSTLQGSGAGGLSTSADEFKHNEF